MMEQIAIRESTHKHYNSFKKLYSISFPLFEQRTAEQQEWAFNCANYHLIGYIENSTLIGFISYWEFSGYRYIEHFAINQNLRGKGYGNKILQSFTTSTDKIVLLEIDPIVDEISAARLRFYEKCGFHKNTYHHTHPPYRDGYQPHSLVVLTSRRQITDEEYQLFNTDLIEVVMSKNRLEK